MDRDRMNRSGDRLIPADRIDMIHFTATPAGEPRMVNFAQTPVDNAPYG
jgi:hypothetical protein